MKELYRFFKKLILLKIQSNICDIVSIELRTIEYLKYF